MPTRRSRSDPEFLAAYGACVRQRRAELGLARKELAERAGISYSYLSSIESGQKLPSDSVLSGLASALELSPADLLARANDMVLAESSSLSADSTSSSARLGTPEASFARTRSSEPPALELSSSDLSASGTSAEIDALLPELSSEDRATLLSVARKLRSESQIEPDEPTSQMEPTSAEAARPELRTSLYLHFWTMYLEELDRRGLDWGSSRSPEPRSYFTTPSPLKGTSLTASFARNRMLRHELYINRGSREANLDLLHAILSEREALERAYGGELEFEDPGEERRAVRIAEYRKGHISKEDEHREYVRWFVDRGERMRRALKFVDAKVLGAAAPGSSDKSSS
jgi:transcriptional regulator with XRE-family HTH domain